MKRLVLILASAVFLFCGCFCANASENVTVFADNVSAEQGESITIPIKIKGNNGLMGFRISVKYPNDKLVLKDVSSGSITADGLFNTTISDYYSVKGNFDVLWSNSSDIKDDGTLFVMTYQVKQGIDDCDCSITFTASQDDTFNEKFENVVLKISPIKVIIGTDTTTTELQQQTNNTEQSTLKTDISNDYLISSVNQILESFGANDFSSLTDEQKKNALEYVNNRNQSYGSDKRYTKIDQLEKDYKNAIKQEAVRQVIESTDPDKIQTISKNVLKKYNAKSFSELPTEQKEQAVNEMLQSLAKENANEDGFNKLKSVDEAAETLDEIVESAQKENDESIDLNKEKDSKSQNKKYILILTAIACLLFVIVAIIFVNKRRVKNEKI